MVIVSEYAEMGSLNKVLKDESIPLCWNTRWNFAEGIAKGLELLHRSGVIHRDLKSHNVLVTKTMEVKITDFGLAKIKKSSEGKTTTFSAKLKAEGTIPWMAPELFNEEPDFGRKSDIYAYGMILWEIATRKFPYKGCIYELIGTLVLMRNMREIIPTTTPKYFAELIRECWKDIPGERPEADVITQQIECMSDDMKLEIEENTSNNRLETQFIMPKYSENIKYSDIKDWLGYTFVYDGQTKTSMTLDILAQLDIAESYFKGEGNTKDYEKAIEYFTKAAKFEYPPAQYKLGLIYYEKGEYKKAGDWIYKAAKQGLPSAQYRMAKLFLMEQYRRVDQAIFWFEKAASQGYAEAYMELASLYHKSDQDLYDSDKAIQSYNKASDLNYGLGSYALAEIYSKVNQNDPNTDTISNISYTSESIRLYKLAADQGVSYAQFKLGEMYWTDQITQNDLIMAVEYLQKAADQGLKEAQEYIDKVYNLSILDSESNSNFASINQDFGKRLDNYVKINLEETS